jgi:hypothetical protein
MVDESDQCWNLGIRSVLHSGLDLSAAAAAGVRGGTVSDNELLFQPVGISRAFEARDRSRRSQSRSQTSEGTKSGAGITSHTSDPRAPFDFLSPLFQCQYCSRKADTLGQGAMISGREQVNFGGFKAAGISHTSASS